MFYIMKCQSVCPPAHLPTEGKSFFKLMFTDLSIYLVTIVFLFRSFCEDFSAKKNQKKYKDICDKMAKFTRETKVPSSSRGRFRSLFPPNSFFLFERLPRVSEAPTGFGMLA